ncbi:uncharacterized protein BO80DRAFT_470820 [Aspergillus ibericus CBS 121593]|uniref:Dienelactone hydrolase domain-containing protein n=1 Tax=Aspergillus ibericus CBS 121593 TaxID=1448316 RepID=A0A395H6L4_9EURO|nr:hypothetical protein BO80DRAFT_470820 [Aspergillus ibericus CBS 121593]RAL03163.1 hypothetical protein BO80DRAFT_470820 [Aspergillus ibericus CBS 121593]
MPSRTFRLGFCKVPFVGILGSTDAAEEFAVVRNCRTIPPVITEAYTPKGTYSEFGGVKTYIAGPTNASIGIIDVYDIFGISSQTLQGADLLAARLNSVVLVPDFFNGGGAAAEWFPPDTEEKNKKLWGFINTHASIPEKVEILKKVIAESTPRFSSVKGWAGFGLCWGGKVTVQISGLDSPFLASAQVHPGLMDVEEARKLTIPHIVLASKDEPVDAVKAYSEIIASNGIGGHVETYTTMWHGWMGARANLTVEEGSAEYKREYNQLADFFEKHLKSEAKI